MVQILTLKKEIVFKNIIMSFEKHYYLQTKMLKIVVSFKLRLKTGPKCKKQLLNGKQQTKMLSKSSKCYAKQ